MDIVKIQTLIAQGRVVELTDINPAEAYLQLGVYQNNNRKIGSGDANTYAPYVIPVSEIIPVFPPPSLQSVLEFDHNLDSGNNFQGTFAGLASTGYNVIAIGQYAAQGNQGTNIKAIGFAAALGNTGSNCIGLGLQALYGNQANVVNAIGFNSGLFNKGGDANLMGNYAGYNQNLTAVGTNAMGSYAASGNSGNFLVAIGNSAGSNQSGSYVSALGAGSAANNQGSEVVALGKNTCNNNAGTNVIGIGTQAGVNNTGNNSVFIGFAAGQNNTLTNSFVIANSSLPSYSDSITAAIAITVPNGAVTGNTYLYYNQSTKSIDAVRL